MSHGSHFVPRIIGCHGHTGTQGSRLQEGCPLLLLNLPNLNVYNLFHHTCRRAAPFQQDIEDLYEHIRRSSSILTQLLQFFRTLPRIASARAISHCLAPVRFGTMRVQRTDMRVLYPMAGRKHPPNIDGGLES